MIRAGAPLLREAALESLRQGHAVAMRARLRRPRGRREVFAGAGPRSDAVAALVIRAAAPLALDVIRLLDALGAAGVETVALVNGAVDDGGLADLRARAATVVLRDNRGFDMGAWQEAWAALADRVPARLILLNDSVFFASKGLDAMVRRLCGPEDAVAAFEHRGHGAVPHLQAFALSVSDHVMRDAGWRRFWTGYAPLDSRVHAIRRGEIRLSAAIRAAARDIHVIHATDRLRDAMRGLRVPLAEAETHLDSALRPAARRLARNGALDGAVVADLIATTSPIHGGPAYLMRHLGAPLVKKDLVYRGHFAPEAAAAFLGDVLPEDEARAALAVLTARGRGRDLRGWDRVLHAAGVR